MHTENTEEQNAELLAMIDLGFLPPVMGTYRRFSKNDTALYVAIGKRSRVIKKWRVDLVNKSGTVERRLSWFNSPMEAAKAAFKEWEAQLTSQIS